MSRESLLSRYPVADERFDELFSQSGQPRAHWQPLLDHLTSIGAPVLDARYREVTRMLRENGVTYNVYADPAGQSRADLEPEP